MTELSKTEARHSEGQEELERFRSIHRLTNHWSRPIGRRSYYWFLTFEHSPELRSLAAMCQQSISASYYDLTPLADLHMTLDRIAFEGDISADQLEAVTIAAARLCENLVPLQVTVGRLGGTPGAIGFTVYPRQAVQELRDRLRATTLAIHPTASVRREAFHPHITIAYCNADGIVAAQAVAAVAALNGTASTKVTITDVALVLLTRLPKSYQWKVVSQIPLSGSNRPQDDRR